MSPFNRLCSSTEESVKLQSPGSLIHLVIRNNDPFFSQLEPFCVGLACSSLLLWCPPIFQRHVRIASGSILVVGMNVSLNGCLSFWLLSASLPFSRLVPWVYPALPYDSWDSTPTPRSNELSIGFQILHKLSLSWLCKLSDFANKLWFPFLQHNSRELDQSQWSRATETMSRETAGNRPHAAGAWDKDSAPAGGWSPTIILTVCNTDTQVPKLPKS